jgi:localization factor PodJL
VRYTDGEAQDLSEAARWFERAAEAGLAPAQYRLAVMYERGQGAAMDASKARSWYAAAARRGNVKAMHNLAVSLSSRDSDKVDYAVAAKWYQEAAAHGLADSQFNLGILAENGLGRPKSLASAYQWFALAAANGDKDAAKRREVVKAQLDAVSLAEAEQLVATFEAKAAIGEANEVAEAAEWASAAPDNNASRAQSLLNKLGYDVGAPDGVAGERTSDAVKRFERRNGLEETGEITIPLVTKLERLTS